MVTGTGAFTTPLAAFAASGSVVRPVRIYESVGNAIRSRFDSSVASANPGPLFLFDNSPSVPISAKTPIVRFRVDFADREQVTVNADAIHDLEGVAVAELRYPHGTGDSEMLSLADKVVNAFRLYSQDAPELTFASPTVGEPFRRRGRVVREVTCPFRARSRGSRV